MKLARFVYMMDHAFACKCITGIMCEWWASHRKPLHRLIVLFFLHVLVQCYTIESSYSLVFLMRLNPQQSLISLKIVLKVKYHFESNFVKYKKTVVHLWKLLQQPISSNNKHLNSLKESLTHSILYLRLSIGNLIYEGVFSITAAPSNRHR